jgi:hypothetical protein
MKSVKPKTNQPAAANLEAVRIIYDAFQNPVTFTSFLMDASKDISEDIYLLSGSTALHAQDEVENLHGALLLNTDLYRYLALPWHSAGKGREQQVKAISRGVQETDFTKYINQDAAETFIATVIKAEAKKSLGGHKRLARINALSSFFALLVQSANDTQKEA